MLQKGYQGKSFRLALSTKRAANPSQTLSKGMQSLCDTKILFFNQSDNILPTRTMDILGWIQGGMKDCKIAVKK